MVPPGGVIRPGGGCPARLRCSGHVPCQVAARRMALIGTLVQKRTVLLGSWVRALVGLPCEGYPLADTVK